MQCYWVHQEDHSAHTETHTLLPDAFVELIFHVGDSRLEGRALGSVIVVGLQEAPLRLVAKGQTQLLGVRCYLSGGVQLLGLDQGLRGYCLEAGADLLRLGVSITGHLRGNDIKAAIGQVDAWLLERQATMTRRNALQASVTELHRSGGQVRMADLAQMLGVTTRQLERLFLKKASVTPKTLARLVRFTEATRCIAETPQVNLGMLACDLGFADQAHFIREFKAFAGVTPRQFARGQRRNRSDFFNANPVRPT